MKHKILEFTSVVIMAAFGGLTNTLTGRQHGAPYSWKVAAPEIVIAVFSGLLVHYILLELDIGSNMRTVGVALAGYSARGVLALLNKLVLQHLASLKLFLWTALLVVALLSGCREIYHPVPYEPVDVTLRPLELRP